MQCIFISKRAIVNRLQLGGPTSATGAYQTERTNMANPATTSHLQEQSHLSPVLQVIHWQLNPHLCPTAAWQTWSPVFVQTLPISLPKASHFSYAAIAADAECPRDAITVFSLHVRSAISCRVNRKVAQQTLSGVLDEPKFLRKSRQAERQRDRKVALRESIATTEVCD